MAAQGPREPTGGGTSIKVPPAPAKPQGMQAREDRRRPPERQAATGGGELALGNWEDATNPPPRRPIAPEAGGGARQIVNLGREVLSARDERMDATKTARAATSVKKVLASGNRPNPELLQTLAGADRQTLISQFGFTEQELKKLGL